MAEHQVEQLRSLHLSGDRPSPQRGEEGCGFDLQFHQCRALVVGRLARSFGRDRGDAPGHRVAQQDHQEHAAVEGRQMAAGDVRGEPAVARHDHAVPGDREARAERREAVIEPAGQFGPSHRGRVGVGRAIGVHPGEAGQDDVIPFAQPGASPGRDHGGDHPRPLVVAQARIPGRDAERRQGQPGQSREPAARARRLPGRLRRPGQRAERRAIAQQGDVAPGAGGREGRVQHARRLVEVQQLRHGGDPVRRLCGQRADQHHQAGPARDAVVLSLVHAALEPPLQHAQPPARRHMDHQVGQGSLHRRHQGAAIRPADPQGEAGAGNPKTAQRLRVAPRVRRGQKRLPIGGHVQPLLRAGRKEGGRTARPGRQDAVGKLQRGEELRSPAAQRPGADQKRLQNPVGDGVQRSTITVRAGLRAKERRPPATAGPQAQPPERPTLGRGGVDEVLQHRGTLPLQQREHARRSGAAIQAPVHEHGHRLQRLRQRSRAPDRAQVQRVHQHRSQIGRRPDHRQRLVIPPAAAGGDRDQVARRLRLVQPRHRPIERRLRGIPPAQADGEILQPQVQGDVRGIALPRGGQARQQLGPEPPVGRRDPPLAFRQRRSPQQAGHLFQRRKGTAAVERASGQGIARAVMVHHHHPPPGSGKVLLQPRIGRLHQNNHRPQRIQPQPRVGRIGRRPPGQPQVHHRNAPLPRHAGDLHRFKVVGGE